MTRGARIVYSAAEMKWLCDNRTMVISDYHRAFCAVFTRSDVAPAHLHGLRKRLGWKVGRAPGRFAGRKQRRRVLRHVRFALQLGQLLPGGYVPEPGGLVPAPGGERFIVRGESDAVNRAGVQ